MMSLIDCMVMHTNEVMIDAGGEGDRWDAWSYMMRDGDIHRPILNTNCGVFRSRDDAISWMNRVVEAVKSVSESGDKNSYIQALLPLTDELITLVEERKKNGELS